KISGQNPRHLGRTGVAKACLALALLVPLGCTRSPSRPSATRGLGQGPSYADTVRFLEQATFGPTAALVEHVQQVGFATCLSEQFGLPASQFPGACYPVGSCGPGEFEVVPPQPSATCMRGGVCLRDNYSMWPLQKIFFQNALAASDQVRQRVFFAL